MIISTDSEHFQRILQVSVLIQKDFRTNCEVIFDFPWFRAKFRETILSSSESEDNSEWITELALNQTKSVQNATWISLWLSSEFAWDLQFVPLESNKSFAFILTQLLPKTLKKSWFGFRATQFILKNRIKFLFICAANIYKHAYNRLQHTNQQLLSAFSIRRSANATDFYLIWLLCFCCMPGLRFPSIRIHTLYGSIFLPFLSAVFLNL